MLTLTSENFESAVLRSDKPVLVDFWAEWCGPCRRQSQVLDRLEPRYEGRAVFAKLNYDDEGLLALTFRVHAIPTLILFRGGAELERLVGLQNEDEITEVLDSAL